MLLLQMCKMWNLNLHFDINFSLLFLVNNNNIDTLFLGSVYNNGIGKRTLKYSLYLKLTFPFSVTLV